MDAIVRQRLTPGGRSANSVPLRVGTSRSGHDAQTPCGQRDSRHLDVGGRGLDVLMTATTAGCPAKALGGSVERGERETLAHFTFEAVELRPATVGCVLPGVEQANP